MYTHFSFKGDLDFKEGVKFAAEMTYIMNKYGLEGEFSLSNKVK